MVKEEKDTARTGVYRCQACGLRYAEDKKARACEAWCRENKSCNIEIIEHALEEGRE